MELLGYFLSEGAEYPEGVAYRNLLFDQKLSRVVSGFVPRLELTATTDEFEDPDPLLLAVVLLLVDGPLIFRRWILCLRQVNCWTILADPFFPRISF